jgi:hypothetical protein
LDQQRHGLVVADVVGDRERQRLVDRSDLGVPAAVERERHHALAGVAAPAGDLAAEHARQRLHDVVGALAAPDVGVVDARARDVDEDLPVPRDGLGQLGELEPVQPAVGGQANGTHLANRTAQLGGGVGFRVGASCRSAFWSMNVTPRRA